MKIVTLIALGLFSTGSLADMLSVEYASFYSHLKKIDGEDTHALQFAFGFKHIQSDDLCRIRNAEIVTQKVTLPVSISAEQRFTLPTEKALKQARAVLKIDLLERANQCDLSVQLETKAKYLKTTYTPESLAELLKQYEVFFGNVGGFMSFLMPDVTGLQLHFLEKLPADLEHGLRTDAKHLFVSKDDVTQMTVLTLPFAPIRITATTE